MIRKDNQDQEWALYYEYLLKLIIDKRIEMMEESFQKRMVEYLLMSERHQDLEQFVIKVEVCQPVEDYLLEMASNFTREIAGWDPYRQMRMMVIVFAFKEKEFLHPINQLVSRLTPDTPEEMVVNIIWLIRQTLLSRQVDNSLIIERVTQKEAVGAIIEYFLNNLDKACLLMGRMYNPFFLLVDLMARGAVRLQHNITINTRGMEALIRVLQCSDSEAAIL